MLLSEHESKMFLKQVLRHMGRMLADSPTIHFKPNAKVNPGEKPSIKLFLFVDDQS